MSFLDLKQKLGFWRGVAALEHVFPHKIRKICIKVLWVLLALSFIVAYDLLWESALGTSGLFFIVGSLLLITIALDAFFYSHVFAREGERSYSYELASVVFSSSETDPVRGFIESLYGQEALLRVGIERASLREFLSSRKLVARGSSFSFSDTPNLVASYLEGLISADASFENFLLAHSVTAKTLEESFRWVSSLVRESLSNERWWSRERLQEVEPIGRSWSYGTAYKLERFSTPLRFSLSERQELHPKETSNLEVILSKSTSANALIVGEEGSGKMEVVEGFARRLSRKEAPRHLSDMVLRVLSLDAIISLEDTKGGFERLLVGILDDMVKAGNLILVIPDIDALLMQARTLGSDLSSLLSPYLVSPTLHIVALSETQSFHTSLEGNKELLQHFDTVFIEGSNHEEVSAMLLEHVIELETDEEVVFTYPAVKSAIDSAGRYFVGEPLYNTAGNILVEAIAHVRSLGRSLITKEDILSVVGTRTGVPTGDVTDSERVKLTNLETLLHERVIGQNEAIRMVSDALRRARSGISSPNRPMGSFLFLGPTGVGKTETAKALAEIFFNKESHMVRLDMSEYDTPDALTRLIGGYDSETPGVLASLAREHQYGVLLLDEFEKTESRVLDLFLQILDEGVFSDAMGRKVSLRNMLIVATSNAGSEKIFEATERGENLLEKKNEIVDEIVHNQLFRPELLNRFDGVVLFHALKKEHLQEIAKVLLGRLAWRLKDRGMTLVVNDTLVDFLVEKGTDPKFGARPLNRAIQDTVEKIIADKIISGALTHGSRVEFTERELQSV